MPAPAFSFRAFLKAPRILLFDEATSALDSHTEEGVMEAVHELAQVGGSDGGGT